MESVRVIEVFHNLFYGTLYVTQSLGCFEAESLDVTVETLPADVDAGKALMAGRGDIGLGGPMRAMVMADAGIEDVPISFIEVNSRDGFVLLSRRPVAQFSWSDVRGCSIVTYSKPPTPLMCLRRILREQAIPEQEVTLLANLEMPDAMQAFKEGRGDFIELLEPEAERWISGGRAYLAASVGAFLPPLPYTAFFASGSFLRSQADVALRFTRAVAAAQRWMAEHDGRAIAAKLAPALPDLPLDVLVRGAERYKAFDLWAADPLLRKEGFDTLQDILREGGLIKGTHAYEDQVVTEFANRVMSEGEA